MSTRSRKRAATPSKKAKIEEKEEKEEKETKAVKRPIIDMNHIPNSVLKEGYLAEEEKIPNYLMCPVCKELYINPEMFPCGHTLCKVCLDSNMRNQNFCPVCKSSCYHRPFPNFVLKELIEQQYPEAYKKRTKELLALQELSQKLAHYRFSSRCKSLNEKLVEFFSEKPYAKFDEVSSFLRGADFNPKVSLDEAKYFISTRLNTILGSHTLTGVVRQELISVGDYLFWITPGDLEPYFAFMEKHKKTKEHKKWSPLIILCHSCRDVSMLKKCADVHQLEIGADLPVDQWRTSPAYWLKEIPLIQIEAPVPVEVSSSDYSDDDEDSMLYFSSEYDDDDFY